MNKKSNVTACVLSCFLVLGLTLRAEAAGLRIFNLDNDQALIKKLEKKGVLSKQDVQEIKKERKESQKEHSLNLSARRNFFIPLNLTKTRQGRMIRTISIFGGCAFRLTGTCIRRWISSSSSARIKWRTSV